MTLKIIEHLELVDVPSASGIAKVNDQLFVIGDNSPFLFALTADYQIQERIRLPLDVYDITIPKKRKPDFEAMTVVERNGKKQLLIFGSGSKSPERDLLMMVEVESRDIQKFSLTDFYAEIIASTALTPDTLNIEAAAAIENRLFLFNREENRVFELLISQFLEYIENAGPIPSFHHCRLSLPTMNGVQAKISGASAVPNESTIVFTASVEDNPNPIDDGAILGSFVGLLNVSDIREHYAPDCRILKDNNQPLTVKVESVEVINRNADRSLQLLLVTDSDGAASELLHVVVSD
ncbi:MAG: hypothetical protein GC193_13860 [Cryomorphaceae bacterium]|nr:hypothetical protein [Cryomorphaceae bacterium]